MLRKLIALSLGLSWQSAAAAPWVQDKGGLYARFSVADETVEGLAGRRHAAYLEFGAAADWTLTAQLESIAYADASDFDSQAWRVTARHQFFQRKALRLSVEAGLLEGAAIGGRNGCDRLGAELRSGAAWSGPWQGQDVFVFAELAGRWHEDCNRIRQEIGLGQQLSDRFWLISQTWIERGTGNSDSTKVQSELLWRGTRVDYSIGYRYENSGLFQEDGVFIAVATQF